MICGAITFYSQFNIQYFFIPSLFLWLIIFTVVSCLAQETWIFCLSKKPRFSCICSSTLTNKFYHLNLRHLLFQIWAKYAKPLFLRYTSLNFVLFSFFFTTPFKSLQLMCALFDCLEFFFTWMYSITQKYTITKVHTQKLNLSSYCIISITKTDLMIVALRRSSTYCMVHCTDDQNKKKDKWHLLQPKTEK